MKNCLQCGLPFEITDQDLAFYAEVSPSFNSKKFAVPEPKLCPPCRLQRRLVWRNERSLYVRKCDLCNTSMLSMYRSGVPFPVYCLDCWWSDKWDPFSYGRDFDFSRPFFDQWVEFQNTVPHFSLAVLRQTMENSDYCNHAGYLKNCYLLVNSDYSEQCLFGKGVNRCFDCLDCLKTYDCQTCYEATNCYNCAFSSYIIDCHNSSDCHFSSNLIGCKNCFGCVNLRNKEFYFFNERLSAEDYKARVADLMTQKNREEIWGDFLAFRKNHFMKWMQEKNTENCSGDYLVECKNCQDSYDCEFLENSRYCSDLKKGEKVSFGNYDISFFGTGVDRSYECSVAGYGANHTLFCENVWQSNDIYYSQFCMQNCHDLFACMGLRHQEFAVFNKKYSKNEYEALCAKIAAHMQNTGEWGEFFSIRLSSSAYNETVVMDYFPLGREEIEEKGWPYAQELPSPLSNLPKISGDALPTNPTDDILNVAIECAETGKLFKIQKAELAFYRKMNLPLPKVHPEQRLLRRLSLKNPRKLWERGCSLCAGAISTTFAPNRPEKVYCEACYLKSVD